MKILIKNEKNKIAKCSPYLLPIKDDESPLGQFFSDTGSGYVVTLCFANEIKKYSTAKQFDLYKKAEEHLKDYLEGLLYYKGNYFSSAQAKDEMLYKFQSFYLAKITQDKQYEVLQTHQINCKLDKGLNRPPSCLIQDVLKTCNIVSRRMMMYDLYQLSEIMFRIFETTTSDKEQKRQYMLQFYNLMYRFVMMIRENEYLMNPINSVQFMADWNAVKIMNGQELDEVISVPKPYPIPFP